MFEVSQFQTLLLSDCMPSKLYFYEKNEKYWLLCHVLPLNSVNYLESLEMLNVFLEGIPA